MPLKEFILHKLLTDLLEEVDRNICTHEETHRGGSIWTICDHCDKEWADDRGGFEPYVDQPAIAAAREFLAAQPQPDLTDAQIRTAFLANGFKIKEGRDDLMPYVYEAARAILKLQAES